MESSRYSWYSDMFSDCSSTSGSSTYSEGSTIPGFIAVPMSDSSEKGSQGSWPGLEQKMYQPYKGQLKLSVYVNYGLLTVHVIMGRHIRSQWSSVSNSCVKLCLMPDDSKRTKCKTEVVHESSMPHYDEKFSFELLDEDVSKRLYISAWNRDNFSKQCEFLGCMSFGIEHIQSQKKIVSGWYYLLAAELGRKKHLQVSDKRAVHSDRGQRNIPAVNQDVQWMEPHTLVVKRGRTGFGFSISGASPVFVSRVDPGSRSDQAGLCKNDCIVRIDGMNVSRSASDSVARIIKHAQKHITLEIQRAKKMDSVPIEDLQASPRKPLYSSTPLEHDMKDIGSLNVSPWRPGRMLPMMPVNDVIEEDEENCAMDESITEPKRLEPIAEESPGGVRMHDYGWLDLGAKMERPKPHCTGLTNSTNTYASSTLPRGFKLKRSIIKGLIGKKDKCGPPPEHQKENIFPHNENYGISSHGHRETHHGPLHRYREKHGTFSRQEMHGVFAGEHRQGCGAFPHGYHGTAFDYGASSQRKTGFLQRQQNEYTMLPQSFGDHEMQCDSGNGTGPFAASSTLPRPKRVSFKDFG